MKHIYLFLTAILISLFAISCDRGEDPSYNKLSLDATNIVLDLTKGDIKKDIKLLSDNGNYRLEYAHKSDAVQFEKDLAKVELVQDNNVFTFIGKKRGVVYFKLYDWTSQESLITVEVKEDVELLLKAEKESIRINVSEFKTEVYDGNGGYQITSNTPEIATAILVEPEEPEIGLDPFRVKADIIITPLAIGEASFTVTDVSGQEKNLILEIDEAQMPFEFTDKKFDIIVGEPLTIQFKGGNGGYIYKSTSRVNIQIDEETRTITASGLTRGSSTITIEDRYNQKISLTFYVDTPFLEDSSPRMRRSPNTFVTLKTDVRIIEYVESTNMTIMQSGSSGSYMSGYGLTYTGDLEVGKKGVGRLYDYDKNGEKANARELSKCEIVQIRDGVYWITFTEKETGYEGYMVFQGPDELGF